MNENSKYEIAWATGFFEGEGSTYYKKGLIMTISQSSNNGIPEVLLRFKEAVNDLGRMYGPYEQKNNRKLIYRWQIHGDPTKEVLRLLWPYLGEVKREQATKAGFLYFPDLTIVSDASECEVL